MIIICMSAVKPKRRNPKNNNVDASASEIISDKENDTVSLQKWFLSKFIYIYIWFLFLFLFYSDRSKATETKTIKLKYLVD